MLDTGGVSLAGGWEGRAGRRIPGAVRLVRRKPLGAAGGVVVLLLVLMAAFAPILATHDFTAMDATATFTPLNSEHWLGTDKFGRDMYSRIVQGARVSLGVGIFSTLLGVMMGGVLGVAGGYFLGWLDLCLQRLLDIMQALPLLVLAMVMVTALGPSLPNVVLAISFPIIPQTARIIRSSTLAVRGMAYVDAARAVGASDLRVVVQHITPNTLGPFIVLATAQFGSAILVEASLSFLGLGVPEPFPSWGRMLSAAAAEYVVKAPWLVIVPGIAISLAVFGFNLLGDALRDVLDPRLKGR
ncbi:MAG: ABC transporter permease [Chloroflexi bacterium]|nr:ABC transporter permease [Chloroflexota bacterium]